MDKGRMDQDLRQELAVEEYSIRINRTVVECSFVHDGKTYGDHVTVNEEDGYGPFVLGEAAGLLISQAIMTRKAIESSEEGRK